MRTFKQEDKVFFTNTDGKRTNEPRTILKIDTTSIISQNEKGTKIWLRKPTSRHEIFKDGSKIILKNYLYEDNNDLIISREVLK